MKTLLIIPAYNEADNICRVVDNLINCYPQYDYVVVNDGSKDKTAAICREHGYNLIDLPANLGLAGAFRSGMLYAERYEYDCAIQIDGDGQHDPRYIDNMIRLMREENCDIVIGSRFINRKKPKSLRTLGNNMIEFAIKATTGFKITDPTSGMRLYNREMIKRFAQNINHGPEPDTVSYLIRCGAVVRETQVQMRERIAGNSYFNMTKAIQYMVRMTISILFIQNFRKRG